ncbi:hypothetical protein GCM10010981_18480 [Dyella nitratireducens]|uniref:Uncharacterized protein n=2 Tax=Dyella nitratireducens TaxID=1849580 RepID=A0ABQ1FUU5_9GAMM|nr:hypothetical protein GCM10010981_18480 [Dyella nitratireducens]GLQ43088.1 hypothetical protein GCM10007902_29380 [Dyella nitratireducens]
MLMSRAQIDAHNQRMFEADPSMYDLRCIGPTLSHAQVETWIRKVSKMPGKTLLDEHDQPIPAATLDAMASNVAFDTIPAQATARSITK